MTTSTSKGYPYPVAGDANNVPLHMGQLAAKVDAAPGVSNLTTTARNALAGADLWDGRLIYNLTTERLEQYDGGSSSWLPAAATINGVETLTNKTLTAPTVNGGTAVNSKLRAPLEAWSIVGVAPAATQNLDVVTAGAFLFTANATTNTVLNVRGDGSTTLNSLLAVGDSVTVSVVFPNGTTPYYVTGVQVDGTTRTVVWAGAAAPAAGNASSRDAYTFTIIKTASNTYTVLGATGRYA